MIRVTVYAGPSDVDSREPSTAVHELQADEVEEALRKIGLEYRTADYFPQRQVVITLDPVDTDFDKDRIQKGIREAQAALESTWLL